MIYFWTWLFTTLILGMFVSIFGILPAVFLTSSDREALGMAFIFATIAMVVWSILYLIGLVRLLIGT